MQKIKMGDEVVLLSGKYKGRRGKVLRVLRKKGKVLRAVVEGCHIVKKHVRANPNENEPGGIKTREAPIPISKLAIYNHATGKPDRVNFKFLEDGRKVRIFNSTKEVIDI